MNQKLGEGKERLMPTSDILFKRIFGVEGNEDITKIEKDSGNTDISI